MTEAKQLPENAQGKEISTRKPDSTSLRDQALEAFWEVIRRHHPQASSADLSVGKSITLKRAAEEAIREWIVNNVTTKYIRPGYRFKLFRQEDRFPDFTAPAGLTGSVTLADEHGVWAKMDQHIEGAQYWYNELHWETEDEFARDTEPCP